MGIENWSTTAADNDSAPPDGAPEGMAPSGVNDTMRQIMASVRAWFEDAQWINFGHVPTRIDNDTFTVPTDLTAIYHAGRRLKVTGSATGYCTIASSSFGAGATTVNVTMDSGNLPATLSTVYVSILSFSNDAAPRGLFALIAAANTFTGTNTFNGSATSVTGSDFSVARSASGSTVDARADNTSNTASSNARLTTKVAGTSAGDAIVNFEIASTQNFTAGIDNSDSDIFKIQAGSSLSGTDGLTITTGNVVQVEGRRAGYRGLNGNPQSAPYTFVADDAGRSVAAQSAGTFTINNSVFAADDIVTFVNTTGGGCTIAGGAGVTLRLMGASGTTGNRTVADYGVATIIAQTAAVFLVGGPGVS